MISFSDDWNFSAVIRELRRGKTVSFTGLFIPVVYKPGFFVSCEVLVFNEVRRVCDISERFCARSGSGPLESWF